MARKRARIVIIDDDANFVQMATMLFNRANYDAFNAGNGVEGLTLVDSTQADLVIIDMVMPLMGGVELIRELRSRAQSEHVPILVLSNLSRVEDKLEAFQAGADDYVTKPVNPKELLARIQALLKRSSFGQTQPAHKIALVGAKGGVGVTTLALNIGVALAQREHQVAIAELHGSRGALRHLLNVPNAPDFCDLLAKEPDSVRPNAVLERVIRHSSGLYLLLAPAERCENPLTPEHVPALLAPLSDESEFLLLDLPADDGPVARKALELSDLILLVTEAEPLSLLSARSFLKTLKSWELDDRVDSVAVARVPSSMMLTRIEIENEMGLAGGEAQRDSYHSMMLKGQLGRRNKLLTTIPPGPELFSSAASSGVPLLLVEPSSAPARAISDLAATLVESLGEAETQKI
jgi:pilus assembly protein CpaE